MWICPRELQRKKYVAVVETLTNESLFALLDADTLGCMAKKIQEFIASHAEVMTCELVDVRNYCHDYRTYNNDEYFITYRELRSLQQFFEVCGKNKLFLHPDW